MSARRLSLRQCGLALLLAAALLFLAAAAVPWGSGGRGGGTYEPTGQRWRRRLLQLSGSAPCFGVSLLEASQCFSSQLRARKGRFDLATGRYPPPSPPPSGAFRNGLQFNFTSTTLLAATGAASFLAGLLMVWISVTLFERWQAR